jgi:CubicO group peptidase (beta-lactamase class C family)
MGARTSRPHKGSQALRLQRWNDGLMMKNKHRSIFLFLFLTVTNLLSAASLSDAQLEEFRKFAVEQMEQDQVPGMTIGFIRWGNQDSLWVEGFGFSDLENRISAKAESAYRLASVSKPMTAAAVLQLAEQGKIDLDSEVQTYVSYFPKKKWPVTVRQLLAHLGGISHYKNYEVEGRIKEHKTPKEAIAIFENFDLIGEPGTKYSYSSYGYNLLAAVVEGASGIPFGEYMKKNVWDPLEMQNTRLDDPTDLIPNRVRGYRILKGQIKNSEFVDISSRFGAGGKRSTVPDLLKFAKGLIEGKLLSPKSMDLVYSSMTKADGHFVDYSAGWGTRPANGHFMLRHTGSQQETSTVLMCFPALKLAIACAINQEDGSASVFANRLYEIVMNERLNLNAYVKQNQKIYQAINSTFASGLSYFEQYKKPMETDPKKLKAAQDYFIRSTAKGNDKLVEDGVHPVAGEPYREMGSYMANVLARKRGADLNTYHSNGAISFFHDYLELCKKEKSSMCEFPRELTRQIAQWDQSWKKTNSEEIRWLRIDADSNLSEVNLLLRKEFAAESAYPDFSRELADLTWDNLLKGNNEKSLQAGELGMSFYPESARHLSLYGISQVAIGDKSRGISYLKKAYQLDPTSPAEPDWISDFAEEMANTGKIPEAFKIMEAALEVHPNNAKLLSDMGEAYLAMENKPKAEEFFQKALKVDPNLERARMMIDRLKP